ncbi:low-density lipoprotein receptor-related protein 4-like [Mercenaria mercenaria]|uniref:low-density lipoprotein receptor-related protein 4-like n=1 Tax=Mercenaria mercenaria TaxID=6596 RepID=UPI00234EC392|nr:low-density lipoprotein receptor-related protein 4-like [Mercenaria mercenaria]
MAKIISVIIWIGLYNGCLSQRSNSTDSLLDERGLVITTLKRDDRTYALVRHVPIYPGYEDFDGQIPGIRITSEGGRTHVLSIDVEFRTRQFYMYDYHLGSILVGSGYHKDLNVSGLSLATLHAGVSKGTVQLAVDWLSHTVYWTDSLFRWIVAVPGEKQKLGKDYYKIIVDYHLDAPDGITLDAWKGLLFWSDNGKHPKIERSDLKGQNRHTIISQHMVSPLSIEADIYGNRIYWIDSYTESILSATYDGSDIKLITRTPRSVYFDLAIYKDVVYVTDIRNDNLYTFNKTTGSIESSVLNLSPPETIYGVATYGEYNQPLKDSDYCDTKKCDHLCISEVNTATCVCSEGYKKNTTTGACQESFANFHKAIVIANSTHICMWDIRSFATHAYVLVCKFTVIGLPDPTPTASVSSTPPPLPTASPRDMIKLFDLDIENRNVFIATAGNKLYKRPVDLPIENDAKEVIAQAAGVISGLAYDTSYSTNLYWSESSTGNIWFVDVDTKSTRRVSIDAKLTLVKPRNLIILSTLRRLAWVAGNQGNESIQTMTVDGTDLRTVVTGLADVTSLIYDNEARLFYFIANGSVHQLSLNGSDQLAAVLEDKTAYLLLHYNNYLAWVYTDPRYGNVWKSKNYGTDTTGVHVILSNTSSLLVDMKVLDIKPKLAEAANPCAYMNGGCEQICIPKYSGDIMVKVCECSIGFKLDTDKVSCRSDVATDNFILVSDWTHNTLNQIHLQTQEINAIVNMDNDIYMGVYFDTNTKRIIWSEYKQSTISSSELDGSDQQTIGNIGNSYPYRMDKDMTTGNLYYTTTSHSNPHIGVLTPSGANVWLKKDFTEETLGDIVVHPGKGWMFYTVIHSISYVARANMDGTNEVRIILGDHVSVPDGLAIDFTRDHLYWSDAHNDTIQRCNFDGNSCVTIVNKTGTFQPEEIRDLVTDGKYLYYSAYIKDHVVRVDLMEPYNTTIVGQNPSLGKLDTMALYISSNRNIQNVSKACQAREGLGNCSSICFPTETGRTCACKDDIPLKPDGRTCSISDKCADIIRQRVQTAAGSEDIVIEIDRNCIRQLDDKCEYRCPDFFAPNENLKIKSNQLTCTNIGWDRQREPLCKELVCSKSSLLNGIFVGSCSQRPGSMCMFKCNQGYTNTTDMVLCNENLNWTPTEYCTATISVSQAQTSGLPVAGVAVGIVLLILVIVALVVVIVFLLRRYVVSLISLLGMTTLKKLHFLFNPFSSRCVFLNRLCISNWT